MADKTGTYWDYKLGDVPVRYHDNGDGTFSRVDATEIISELSVLAMRIQDGTTSALAAVVQPTDAFAAPAATALEVLSFTTGFNGTTHDRLRSASAADAAGLVASTGILKTLVMGFDSANNYRPVQNQVPADAMTNALGALLTTSYSAAYNGATWDRLRTAGIVAAGTALGSNTGVLATTIAISDGSNYYPVNGTSLSNDGGGTGGIGINTRSYLIGFNGTTWDRLRTATGDGVANTGILGAGAYMLRAGGATLDRLFGANGSGTAVNAAPFPLATTTMLWDDTSGAYNFLRGARGLADGANGDKALVVANYGYNGTNWDKNRTATSDTLATTGIGAVSALQWDERASTFERPRSNLDVQLLASASRTSTQTSADLLNYNGQALEVVLDVTVIGTGSITVTINMKDSTSGKYILLLSGAAVVGNGTTRYRISPTIAASANLIAQDYISRVFQIVVTANNANAVTYSVGYHLVSRS